MQSRDDIVKQLITIRDYMRWAVTQFTQAGIYYGHGTDNAWDEALQLVMHGLHLPPTVGPEILDARLTVEERKLLLVLFDTRIEHRLPVPYITGSAWFAGLEFKVDERVIVPRSPIAELIEQQYQPWLACEDHLPKVMDLCCGSGCIGIATAMYMDVEQVDVLDISDDALQVASLNVAKHQLGELVNVVKSDVFSALEPDQSYDLIVSNPPYVDKQDIDSMPQEFHHEPALALASGDDGLELTHLILAQAANYLTDNGVLIVEVGNSGAALEMAYPDIDFTWIEFQRGGHGVFVLDKSQLLWLQENYC